MAGVPVLPLTVPGTAVSPGKRICKLVNVPGLKVIAGLVFGVRAGCVTSDAVNVELPAVFKVTVKLFVPDTSGAFAGKVAFTSVEVIPTESLMVLTRFQLASTALTVALKAVPAD